MHFDETKLKLSVQSSSDHGIRSGSWQLVKEFNNNCKQTSNLTKFRSFALHKRNEKIYRKPHNTLLNTALERLDPQAEQKVNYAQEVNSAQEVLQHWRISASWCFWSLRLRLKYKCKRSRPGGVTHLPRVPHLYIDRPLYE